jgi:uncharacterized iron-regulated membrane protein
METRARLYRTIWRWHFYAGLFVMPFVLILAVSGAIYLFKPQIDRWEERAFAGLPNDHAVSADAQVAHALQAFPGAKFDSYRLPERKGDAALVHLDLGSGTMRDVFVSPQGQMRGSLDPEGRITNVVFKLHGELLLGTKGSWAVELAGSWTIVMILTGLYLWWPAGRGLAGVIWPRLRLGKRALWRDLHAVTGFWVSGLALVLLVTGLPWTNVWGQAFAAVRAEFGWFNGASDWVVAGAQPHAAHDHSQMHGMAMPTPAPVVSLSTIVEKANALHLDFPVLIRPPGANERDASLKMDAWTVKSETQNRPRRVTFLFDAATGRELSRTTFANQNPIDRAVGYGIAWHEGQLFGWINQLVGLLTAAALLTLMVSGFVMWRRRKPHVGLGAPPVRRDRSRTAGVAVIIVTLAALLPLLALSLAVILAIEWTLLRRWPRARSWLGLESV